MKTTRWMGLIFGIYSFTATAVTPVSDAALTLQSYQQMTQQFEQAVQQLEMLRQQYEHMRRIEAQTTGSGSLGNLFTEPLVLDNMPADWLSMASFVKSTPEYSRNRAKYPSSSNPSTSAVYDQAAIGETTMQLIFERSQQRVQRVENLRKAINNQTDPSRKSEMSNRLSAEIAAIQADNQMVARVEKNLVRDSRDAERAAHHARMCKEFDNKPKGCQQ